MFSSRPRSSFSALFFVFIFFFLVFSSGRIYMEDSKGNCRELGALGDPKGMVQEQQGRKRGEIERERQITKRQ